jgi:Flp pilus assembly protein TadG
MLLVSVGIFEFGRAYQTWEVLTNAAREGARVAVLPDYSAADAQTRAQAYLNAAFLANPADADIDVGAPQTVVIGGKCMRTVTVTVTYPHEYTFIAGIAQYFNPASDFGTRDLVASSTMRSEVAAATCP